MRLRTLTALAVAPAALAATLAGTAVPAQAATAVDKTVRATCKQGAYSPVLGQARLEMRVRGTDRGSYVDISRIDVRVVNTSVGRAGSPRGATHRGSAGGVSTWSTGTVAAGTWLQVKGSVRVYDGARVTDTAWVDFVDARDNSCTASVGVAALSL